MLRAGEHSEETSEYHLEAVLSIPRREVRDRWLFSDHELQLGHEVDDELTVWVKRLAKRVSPSAKLGLALSQDRANKILKRLCESGIRDVAFVLVELAGREQAARWHERLVQFIHHRGFAHPGVTGHEHEFRRAVHHDPVEGGEQSIDLAFTSIKSLGD